MTTLRFVFGCATLAACAILTCTSVSVPLDLVPQLIALAAIPGLGALMLYYSAPRQTPAARATLAELAFSLTAAAVGVTVLGADLDSSQWFGFAVVVIAVVLLTLHENKSRPPAVAIPERADEALK